MTLFRYSAVPGAGVTRGELRRGEIAGETAAAARAALRELGLQVVELRPVSRRDAGSGGERFWHRHLRQRRAPLRADLYDGLATMLESGLPMLEALDTLTRAQPPGRRGLRQVLAQVREGVRSGEPLAQPLRAQPGWFDPTEVAMIEAGQHGGTLAEVLRALAVRLAHSGELVQKLLTALTYPAIVALAGVGALLFISTRTLPEIARILEDSEVPVPALTESVMGFGQMLAGTWWLWLAAPGFAIAAAVGGGALARRRGWELPRGLARWSPSIGRRIALARIATRLGELMRTGVPLVESLRVVAPTTGHGGLRRRLGQVAERVEAGDELGAALDDPLYFDPEFRRLVEVGEASGDLDQLLTKLGERYERGARRQIERLAALLEPAVILGLAVAIGVVVLAAILPLARLQDILG